MWAEQRVWLWECVPYGEYFVFLPHDSTEGLKLDSVCLWGSAALHPIPFLHIQPQRPPFPGWSPENVMLSSVKCVILSTRDNYRGCFIMRNHTQIPLHVELSTGGQILLKLKLTFSVFGCQVSRYSFTTPNIWIYLHFYPDLGDLIRRQNRH